MKHLSLVPKLIFIAVLLLVRAYGFYDRFTLTFADGQLQAYINGKSYLDPIPVNQNEFNNLKINLNSNIPKPFFLQPQLTQIKINQDEICYNKCPTSVILDSNINSLEITTRNTFALELSLDDRQNRPVNGFKFFAFNYRSLELYSSDSQGNFTTSHNNFRQFYYAGFRLVWIFLLFLSLPLPYLILLYLFLKLIDRLPQIRLNFKKIKIPTRVFSIICGLTLVSAFYYLWYVMTAYTQRIPHSPDSVAYLWQAKYLASFKPWLDPPSDFFIFSDHPVVNNHWVIFYPPGHALFLAFGWLIGRPWLIPVTVGTINLLLMYKFLHYHFDKFTSYTATVLFFLSPFFQTHAATFMSHNTALLAVLVVLIYSCQILTYYHSSVFLSVLAGIMSVIIFTSRPYIALSLALTLGAVFGIKLLKKEIELRKFFPFIISVVVCIAIYFVYNQSAYGGIFANPYFTIHKSKTLISGNGFNIFHEITEAIMYFAYYALIFFPNLPIVFFSIFTLAFLNPKKNVMFIISLLYIFLTFAVTVNYEDMFGFFYGPRFWYEFIPAVYFLLIISISTIASWSKNYPNFIKVVMVLVLVLVSGYKNIRHWVLASPALLTNTFYTPGSIKELKGFNIADDRLNKLALKQGIHNALIFVNNCDTWVCYGSVFYQNDVDFNGDIVWAKNLGERNAELINRYPDRQVYIADFYTNSINKYEN